MCARETENGNYLACADTIMDVRTPDFLIIGAQKAGTTSLYEYLRSHPEIWFPEGVKETHFFTYWGSSGYESESSRVYVTTEKEEYLDLFADAPLDCLAGEASPSYLYDSEAPKRIRTLVPNVSLIAILRDPVQRAYSNYLHAVRSGRESHSFADALEMESDRIQNGAPNMLHYRSKGLYGRQIARYVQHFGRDQLLVLLSEDLWENRLSTLQSILNFLDVDSDVTLDASEHHGASGVPKSDFLRSLYQSKGVREKLKAILPRSVRATLRDTFLHRPQMDEKTARQLRESYREDLERLQELIEQDVSDWLRA